MPLWTVYTGAVNNDGNVALYRIEITLTAGTGKLRMPSGLERGLKESLQRAWSHLRSIKDRMGYEPLLAHRDIVAEAIDLSGGRVE